ncbi:unnamed protein product [Mytilus coruscus]|uniref:Endonuclease/exonuclease/phosphatase domain-containing protein n=1 Tax=Mytilus coruscus TaxID=42192 RepID=A0A6J8E1V8_MYTCO|nr:unnamed protein product [Mytilus coruscus]
MILNRKYLTTLFRAQPKQHTTRSRLKQNPTKSPILKQTSQNNAEEHLRLTTINMEGKGNALFINSLESSSDIICIQEQSLCNVLPNMDMFIRCSDTYEEISNFNRPRGKGGVAIAWKRFLTPSISEIPSGNNRIIAIELKSPMKICIICVYICLQRITLGTHI